jgi:THO complex subunit 5
MIPAEEFLSLHPEYSSSSSSSEAASSDHHDLTIARIEDEHAARKELDARRLELEKKRDALVKKNEGEKMQLAALDDGLEKWIVGGQERSLKLFEGRAQTQAQAQVGENEKEKE